MAKPLDKGGGLNPQPSPTPGQTTVDAAWAEHGMTGGTQQRSLAHSLLMKQKYDPTLPQKNLT